jgi:hypothetical protein
LGLSADDVLKRGGEFCREPTMGHQNHADHAGLPLTLMQRVARKRRSKIRWASRGLPRQSD